MSDFIYKAKSISEEINLKDRERRDWPGKFLYGVLKLTLSQYQVGLKSKCFWRQPVFKT